MTHLLTQMSLAFPDPRPRAAAVEVGLGLLCAQGRRTITAALTVRDRTDRDWSEAYRLFSHDQCVEAALFEPILRPGAGLAQPAAGYRPRQGGRLLCRYPAFWLDARPTVAAQDLLAAYMGRWEVEVSHRDEKSVVGVGQAEVRVPQAVQRAPQFLVACYAALLWCSIRVYGDHRTEAFGPLPRWRRMAPLRPSIQELLRLLRRQAAQAKDDLMRTNGTRS
jgi:hypothetical protein